VGEQLELQQKTPRTPIVSILLLINGAAFFLELLAPGFVIRHFALWPLGDVQMMEALPAQMVTGEFHLWQLLTYAFLHGSVWHLFLNMFVLWMFGMPVEAVWGRRLFIFYYLICVVGAAIVQLLVVSSGVQAGAPSLGASGGVFAILMAFGMLYPNQTVVLLFPPIPMKAKYFVVLIGIVQLMMGLSVSQTGVAYFAHLAGMVFGLLFIVVFRLRRR